MGVVLADDTGYFIIRMGLVELGTATRRLCVSVILSGGKSGSEQTKTTATRLFLVLACHQGSPFPIAPSVSRTIKWRTRDIPCRASIECFSAVLNRDSPCLLL